MRPIEKTRQSARVPQQLRSRDLAQRLLSRASARAQTNQLPIVERSSERIVDVGRISRVVELSCSKCLGYFACMQRCESCNEPLPVAEQEMAANTDFVGCTVCGRRSQTCTSCGSLYPPGAVACPACNATPLKGIGPARVVAFFSSAFNADGKVCLEFVLSPAPDDEWMDALDAAKKETPHSAIGPYELNGTRLRVRTVDPFTGSDSVPYKQLVDRVLQWIAEANRA